MSDIKEIIEEGKRHFREGHYEEAIVAYKRVINAEPENIDAMINMGISYVELKDYEKGIELYKRVLEIEPENKYALNNMGWARECQGKIEEAKELYIKSLDKDSSFDNALINITNILLDNKEYDTAIDFFKKALEKDPFNVANWIDLGRTYRQKEEYELAISAYNKALELNPNDKLAWNNLGYAYFCQELYDKAIEAIKKSLERDWLFDIAYSNLLLIFDKLIEINSQEFDLWKELANVFIISKEYGKALDSCNRAIEIKPEDKEIIELQDKIITSKKKIDVIPILENNINEALYMFSSISYSVLVDDAISYIKYKDPDLEFSLDEIKFMVFEFINKRNLNIKLDGKNLIFVQPDKFEEKKGYMV
ncbi:MAG: tetratricopeptide repeat protein [Promethearchaeota archaeon]